MMDEPTIRYYHVSACVLRALAIIHDTKKCVLNAELGAILTRDKSGRIVLLLNEHGEDAA